MENITINYKTPKSDIKVKSNDDNLNFILTANSKNNNSWLNFGIKDNTDKFQGVVIEHNKSEKLYKTIEQLKIVNTNNKLRLFEIEKEDHKFIKKYENENSSSQTTESFRYTKFNTVVYTNSANQEVILELDCRELNDYDTENRNYKIEKEDEYTIIKYTKINNETKNYELFVVIENKNCEIEIINKWIEKEYSYSKQRNQNDKNLFIFQALKFKPKTNKAVYISSGFSQNEVIENIKQSKELHKDKFFRWNEDIKDEKINLAYNLSQSAYKTFKLKKGKKAGFFWFNQVWTRDELSSLNVDIENRKIQHVKDTVLKYLELIKECGMIPRIQEKGSLESPDGLFWLGKRIYDTIKKLEEKKQVMRFINQAELDEIFNKLDKAFTSIFDTHRDIENELLKVEDGDSWMDTIKINFPLDVQVQLLGYLSTLEKISRILNKKSKDHAYILLENFFKQNLKDKYYKNGFLYDDIENTRITSNIFLIYYFYPNMFDKVEWEKIIDKTLPKLMTPWGGISTLDIDNQKFTKNNTGENNISYHNGDSWYWINNLTALVLHQINPTKYLKIIDKIIETSTKDILELGTIGYHSEISEFENQKAQGNLAQLWSSAYYIELINNVYRKNKKSEDNDKYNSMNSRD
jgi:hypothetical protein